MVSIVSAGETLWFHPALFKAATACASANHRDAVSANLKDLKVRPVLTFERRPS
jgi:ectoine hydroxylase-related dioxygenase (phytanoyl-CoA dioxygenase family)